MPFSHTLGALCGAHWTVDPGISESDCIRMVVLGSEGLEGTFAGLA